ncbi:hypothetical protein BC629DRAFT_1461820 [Irpex lacteus]|nr:hypothetical protein BC629DRAFT_1544860 [Irpex lacteus]KAI0821536.1 hypothetical protein BC629DRAFT_1461820 [Irpex lacteus]
MCVRFEAIFKYHYCTGSVKEDIAVGTFSRSLGRLLPGSSSSLSSSISGVFSTWLIVLIVLQVWYYVVLPGPGPAARLALVMTQIHYIVLDCRGKQECVYVNSGRAFELQGPFDSEASLSVIPYDVYVTYLLIVSSHVNPFVVLGARTIMYVYQGERSRENRVWGNEQRQQTGLGA